MFLDGSERNKKDMIDDCAVSMKRFSASCRGQADVKAVSPDW